MKDPKTIAVKDYTYDLPAANIPAYPLPERDASRLLVYKQGSIEEGIYSNIAAHIPGDSLLIFNDTKVVEARLLFQKPTGGQIEIFCLEPHEKYPDITTAMLQKEKVWWQCLLGGASKWKAGQTLEKSIQAAGREIKLSARFIEKRPESFIIELSWFPVDMCFAELLHHAGAIPLPPYIKRAAEGSDAERYQTIYAKTDGSVAAPTAGLHFTKNIFESLSKKNIKPDHVTLHVGAGTFKPVKTETIQDHIMHAEWIDVSKNTIENILSSLGKNIIAVGTTSLRTIESLYWIGVSSLQSTVHSTQSAVRSSQFAARSSQSIHLGQWEAYELMKKEITVKEALQSLLEWMDKNKQEKLIAKTGIMIVPGYNFKIIDGLITNFHQPQSTLLLLVAALIGDDWRSVYKYALEKDFRFLSYGDGSLLWKNSA